MAIISGDMTTLRGRPAHAANPLAPSASEVIAARQALGVSQAEAAFLAGVGVRTWCRWERGECAANPLKWNKFLAAMGLEDNSPPPPSPTSTEILRARAKHRISIQEASKMANVPLRLWCDWEGGQATMDGETWRKWLKSFI